MSHRPAIRFLIPALLCLVAALPAAGSEVRFFSLQSRDAFLSGTLDGITVDPLGTLALADRGVRHADLTEPFIFAGAAHPEGWVLGTGNGGRVLLLDRKGELSTLFTAPEPEVFAVWVDPDGAVFAGTSPDGKVYRITQQGSGVFFDPGETYIWDLVRGRDGSLLVATGTEGKLYRVDRRGAGEVVFDSEDTHIRSLQLLPGGDVLAGSAGDGLILRISSDGVARTLYDADQPEVVDFAAAPDGSAYAAVLASEASLVDLTRRGGRGAREGGKGQQQGNDSGGSVRVTMSPASGQGEEMTGTRPRGFKGPRSRVLRISPNGVIETVLELEDETVYALHWQRDRLWIGTGLEGKLYSMRKRRMVLEKDVDERQIITLMDDSPGPAFATTNAGAFYRISSETERQGTYTSAALDAGQTSEFGSLAWRGAQPSGTGLRLSFRSGVSAEPDRTWSQWTEPRAGREVSLADVPPGRYVQWRAELTAADGRSPSISRVEISYRQINLPPRATSFTVLGPGEVRTPASFNPSVQIFEPTHPNREGMFTTLEPSAPRDERRRKTLWKKGFRTLEWEAADPNEDELFFELAFQPEGGGELWLPMEEELEEDSYSFDATALPDGVYRFRLRISDRRPGAAEPSLDAEEVSEPVVVDHTVPELASLSRQQGGIRVDVRDAMNPLRRAEVSIDAGEWRPVTPEDGILDGRRETLQLDVPSGARLVLLRLSDAAFNVVTFDLLQESR